MKQKVSLGIVCLARKTYDYRAAEELYKNILINVKKIENVEWTIIEDLVIEKDEGEDAGLKFAASNLDGIVCISGTFHLGHLPLLLKRHCDVPMLLWGLPELPYNGGKIRLNSVCGVNLNASNLYKSGFNDYQVCIDNNIDEDWIDALRVIRALNNSHIGILGFRADGFFNVGVQDNNVFDNTGAIVDHFELSDVINLEVPKEDIESRKEQVKSLFDCSSITEDQVNKVALLSAKLNKFYLDNKLNALAIRCWPEFARDFGISPCAAMSILQSEDKIFTCEGDIDGSLSQIAHRALGAETPFLFDFSQVDFEEDFALFWHCGVAPCNLWDGVCNRSLDTYFAGGRGVTADFVLRSGDVSVLRLDSARGKYRMFIQDATAIPMEKLLKGTYLKAKFDRPVKEVLDIIVDNGIAHHSSVVYGSFLKPLRIVAKLKGWEIFE
ncbi:MAG: fucose isomerase [Pleomorphochaeta sp.]